MGGGREGGTEVGSEGGRKERKERGNEGETKGRREKREERRREGRRKIKNAFKKEHHLPENYNKRYVLQCSVTWKYLVIVFPLHKEDVK